MEIVYFNILNRKNNLTPCEGDLVEALTKNNENNKKEMLELLNNNKGFYDCLKDLCSDGYAVLETDNMTAVESLAVVLNECRLFDFKISFYLDVTGKEYSYISTDGVLCSDEVTKCSSKISKFDDRFLELCKSGSLEGVISFLSESSDKINGRVLIEALILSIKYNCIEIADLLLDQRVDVNTLFEAKSGVELYPLFIATKYDRKAIALKLLEKGANPNLVNSESVRAISYSIKYSAKDVFLVLWNEIKDFNYFKEIYGAVNSFFIIKNRVEPLSNFEELVLGLLFDKYKANLFKGDYFESLLKATIVLGDLSLFKRLLLETNKDSFNKDELLKCVINSFSLNKLKIKLMIMRL
ncbi:ankyrin repeat domain-containing protein [Zooshikella harenae]|uniref:Ankyrin repeat domain-containing protein n=1 Tax=Zooshikella harenae TaxID=2827238 RepID=A0ABS5ZI52_9GAMM|nr:ankyrin repeat domain-containing protein [Zooshikella harenae]MBU2713753.1 hypothetical protein [Zooshikella harenae]